LLHILRLTVTEVQRQRESVCTKPNGFFSVVVGRKVEELLQTFESATAGLPAFADVPKPAYLCRIFV
jgi:hypothetical protein